MPRARARRSAQPAARPAWGSCALAHRPSNHRWGGRVLLAIAVTLIGLSWAAIAIAAPSLSVVPAFGPAGSSAQVAGSGFVSGVRGRILFDGGAAGMPTFKVAANGTFSAPMTIPAGASPGAHSVQAKLTSGPQKNQIVAAATFTVAPPATPSPTPSPSPTPTPSPTPEPTPEPTPSTTPEPTPSTPEPTPSTTPEATPPTSPTPTVSPQASPLAFPGAVGYGRTTPGGRGGDVLFVTTLADDGPGSLRAALEASGPRTVVIRVSGVITLASTIKVESPYLTVAGQTAPGDGVVVRGEAVKILTHDVVIRHLRFRTGDATTGDPSEADGLTIHATTAPISNIVLDHVDMTWGPDIGGLAVLGPVWNVTVQNSIMGEGLYLSRHPEGTVKNGGHAFGVNVTPLVVGGGHAERLTFYRNLFTDAEKRMPAIRSADCVDLVNNVIYDWGTQSVAGNPRGLNVVNNWYRWGPVGTSRAMFKSQSVAADPVIYPDSVFMSGNVADGFVPSALSGTVYATTARCGGPSVVPDSADAAWTAVIDGAGATLPVRDEVDRRIIDELVARSGGYLNGDGQAPPNPSWPLPAQGSVPADADLDGMPDAWEAAAFGDVGRDGRGDADGDGYTDLEEYLNAIGG
jgi:pectate lyase